MGKKDKDTTTHKLGLRITAMKVFQVDKNDYVGYAMIFSKKKSDLLDMEKTGERKLLKKHSSTL